MSTPVNPTVASLHQHLVVDNMWHELEFSDFLERHAEHVNEDGTTDLTHDAWEHLAMSEPESN